jgi:hypothetical protein
MIMAEEPSSEPRPYRRLPGRGRRTGGCISVGAPISTIWLADDHLLLRESIYGLSETYKRFYFRDVQAIIIRRSPRWIGWIAVWTILSFVFFFSYIAAGWRGWSWLIFFSVCFVLTMIQLARGPTCVTHLVTAVQRELLGSLNTLRKARRALQTLVPLIQAKQGTVDPSVLVDARTLPGQPANAAARVDQIRGISSRPAMAGPPVMASQLSRLSVPHLVLFAATFVGGGAALWESFRPSPPSLIGAAILLAVIIILSVFALVAQGRRRMNKAVTSLTWTIMIGYIVAWFIIYTVYSSMHALQRSTAKVDPDHPPRIFSELSAAGLRQMPGFDYVLWFYGGLSVALGVTGMAALLLRRQRLPQPPPLPPSAVTTGS